MDWPHHSVDGKTAFIVVTQSFLLHIVWQLDGQPWPDATVALNDPSSSDDILTHAAFVDANRESSMETSEHMPVEADSFQNSSILQLTPAVDAYVCTELSLNGPALRQ